MAQNTCPICGERLVNGVCPDCVGDAYEAREDFNEAEYNRIYNETHNGAEEIPAEDVRVIDGEPRSYSYTTEKTETFGNGVFHSVTTVTAVTDTDRVSFESRNSINPSPESTACYVNEFLSEDGEIPEEVLEEFAEFSKEIRANGRRIGADIQSGEKTPLKELIFSKENRWKFIVSAFVPLAGLFIVEFSKKSRDRDKRRVEAVLLLWSFIVPPILLGLLNRILMAMAPMFD